MSIAWKDDSTFSPEQRAVLKQIRDAVDESLGTVSRARKAADAANSAAVATQRSGGETIQDVRVVREVEIPAVQVIAEDADAKAQEALDRPAGGTIITTSIFSPYELDPVPTAPEGAVWWQVDADDNIIGQWQYLDDGSGLAWVSQQIASDQIVDTLIGKRIVGGTVEGEVEVVAGGSLIVRPGTGSQRPSLIVYGPDGESVTLANGVVEMTPRNRSGEATSLARLSTNETTSGMTWAQITVQDDSGATTNYNVGIGRSADLQSGKRYDLYASSAFFSALDLGTDVTATRVKARGTVYGATLTATDVIPESGNPTGRYGEIQRLGARWGEGAATDFEITPRYSSGGTMLRDTTSGSLSSVIIGELVDTIRWALTVARARISDLLRVNTIQTLAGAAWAPSTPINGARPTSNFNYSSTQIVEWGTNLVARPSRATSTQQQRQRFTCTQAGYYLIDLSARSLHTTGTVIALVRKNGTSLTNPTAGVGQIINLAGYPVQLAVGDYIDVSINTNFAGGPTSEMYLDASATYMSVQLHSLV